MVKNTIKEVLFIGSQKLKDANIEGANTEAVLILANVLRKTKEYIFTYNTEVLDNQAIATFFSDVEKRANNIPLQYITRSQDFMGLEFYVDENTLIPRADTETLVEYIINYAKNLDNLSILDLCTGSGCIALSLAYYLKGASVLGIDISEGAISNAMKNAELIGLEDKVHFKHGDLFEGISDSFNIVVSNPPYIKAEVIETLQKEVKNEPYIALNGGKDGLDFYRRIISEAHRFLKPNGLLAVEIGYDQRESVKELFLQNRFDEVFILKDLSGNDRVVSGIAR